LQKLELSQRTRNLRLALSQANKELEEANSQRRVADEKTYAILSVTLAFIGLLVALRPWRFIEVVGIWFFTAALILYAGTVLIGIKSYFPREFPATKSRAILDELDRPHEVLTMWVLNAILEFAEKNYRMASQKGYWLKVSIVLFLMATVLLIVSFVPDSWWLCMIGRILY